MRILGLLVVVAIIAFIFIGGSGGDEKPNIQEQIETKNEAHLQLYEVQVNKAIQFYKLDKGQLPTDISELEGLPEAPQGYEVKINQQSGKIELIPLDAE